MIFDVLKKLLIFLIFFLNISFPLLAKEVDNLNDLGITAYETQNYDLAATYFKETLKIDPTFYKSENNLALVEYAKGNKFTSIIHFFRAIRIKKDFKSPKTNLLNIIKESSNDRQNIGDSIETISLIGEISKKENLEFIFNESQKKIFKLIDKTDNLEKKTFSNSMSKIFETYAINIEFSLLMINLIKRIDKTRANSLLEILTETGSIKDTSLKNLIISILAKKTNNNSIFNEYKNKLKNLPTNNKEIINEANKLYETTPQPIGELKNIIVYIQNKQFFKAELRLKKLKKNNGTDETYLFLKAFLKFKRGMRSGARQVMSIFDPNLIDDSILLESSGTLLAKIGMEKKALQCFENGIEKFPENGEFYFKAAILQDKFKNGKIAENYIEEAVKLRPYFLRYKYFASQILRNNGKNQEAEKIEKEILNNNETSYQSTMIRLNKGANSSDGLIINWNFDIKNLFNEKLKTIDKNSIKKLERQLITEEKPSKSGIKFLYNYYSNNKIYKKALIFLILSQKYEIVLKTLPWIKAELFLNNGLPNIAEKEYFKILEKNSTPSHVRFNYGFSIYISGKTEEAFIKWNKILGENDIFEKSKVTEIKNGILPTKILSKKTIIKTKLTLIQSLLLHKEKKNSIKFLKENIKDGDLDSLLLYIELLMNSHKPDLSLKIMKKFIKKNGANPALYSKMGDICYQVGSYEKAIKFYNKLGKRDNFSVRLLIRLGDMKIKLNKIEEGILYYNIAKFKTLPGELMNKIKTKLKNIHHLKEKK
jgi:tetratricopeptide (TPR) repeat protein